MTMLRWPIWRELIALSGILIAGCQAVRPDPLPPVSDAPPLPGDSSATPGHGSSPTRPAPAGPQEPEPRRGPIFVYATELVVRESFPIQVDLRLSASLPTPCAEFGYSVAEPDDEGRIEVEAWSLHDPEQVCIQVLKEFEASIGLGSFSSGAYSVWLNGKLVGEFET